MRRSGMRMVAIVLISLVLVLGSFVVGNFGLSEGMRRFPYYVEVTIYGDFGPVHLPPYVSEASEGLIASVDFTTADVIMLISVIIALFCMWDSLKDGVRMGIEEEGLEVEKSVEPPVYRKLKYPPVPQQPKRHASYRHAG